MHDDGRREGQAQRDRQGPLLEHDVWRWWPLWVRVARIWVPASGIRIPSSRVSATRCGGTLPFTLRSTVRIPSVRWISTSRARWVSTRRVPRFIPRLREQPRRGTHGSTIASRRRRGGLRSAQAFSWRSWRTHGLWRLWWFQPWPWLRPLRAPPPWKAPRQV